MRAATPPTLRPVEHPNRGIGRLSLKRLLAGLLIACALGFAPVAAQETPASATLNLNDVDIRVLINTVSELTGRNFVIDPRIKARVTVVSSRPMAQEEIYAVFLSVLEVHGFAAVPAGDVIKIVPDVNAKQGPVPTTSLAAPGLGDEMVTQVIEIRNVPAAQLVPILRPLVPQQGHLAAYPSTNVLVISDRAANINRLAQIIRRIDRDDNEEIEVLPLQNASAAEVVRVVSSLLQSDAQAAGGQIPGAPVLAADERTNSILLAGGKAARLRIRALIAHLDTPLETAGDALVIFLKYADAADMVTILQGASRSPEAAGGAGAQAGRQNQVDIQADEASNALIITGSPSIQRTIQSIVRQLDIPRAQVLVEAIIAEISTGLTQELGVQIAVAPSSTTDDDQGPIGLTNFGGAQRSLIALSQNPLLIGSGLTAGVADLRDGRTNFAVLLSALAGDAATNILSTPTLLTMDNAEAEIVVGQNLPFVTGQFTNTGSAGTAVTPFQTIERQDVGLTLRVKPQINEGDALRLEIEQEVSSVAASSLIATDVVTNKRSIRTTVMAEDGEIIILGGLIEDTFRDSQEKVPLLGDIPLLGRLFRYDSTTKEKQNLMVFIHPVILRDQRTAAHYTSSKYSALQARQLEADIENRGLVRDSASRLPTLDELATPPPEPLAPAAPAVEPVPESQASPESTPEPTPDETEAGPQGQGEAPAETQPETPRQSEASERSEAPANTATLAALTPSAVEPDPLAPEPVVAATPGRDWIMDLPAGFYTVQIAAGTEVADLDESASRLPAGVTGSIVKTRRGTLDWYLLVAGAYPSVADARLAIEAMPEDLRRFEPWVRAIGDLHQAVAATGGAVR
jgi:general secretion pathway protein D